MTEIIDDISKEIEEAKFEETKVKQPKEQMVSIPLSEYVNLKLNEQDMSRLISAIEFDLYLGYDNAHLRSSGDNTMDMIKGLYPDFYKEKLKELQKAEENKEEG